MQNSPIRYHRYSLYTHGWSGSVRTCLSVATIFLFLSTGVADEIDVWIGTGADGVYYLTLDTEKGEMSLPKMAAEMDGAGFLAMHPGGQRLYATDSAEKGSVTAFAIESSSSDKSNPGKRLRRLNSVPTGDGDAACIGIDKTGASVFSVQYGGGSVSSFLLDSDGDLDRRVELIEHGKGSGVHGNRQNTAHPHWAGTSPDNRFLMVPDLGLDRVVVYALDPTTAKLKQKARIAVPPGSGPRHMKFHTTGKYAYVLNELTLAISVFAYDPNSSEFSEIQSIETLPEHLKDKYLNSAAEIRVHPTGKFVYSSNRGHDSIAVFSVNQETGKLSFVEREAVRGSWPRNFNIDPSGKWLIAAGRKSNSLALFEIEPQTGELTFTRQVVNVPAPICVLFQSE